jgi:hypothetical protein
MAALGCLLSSVALAWMAVLPSAASAGPARYVYEVCDSALPGGGTPGVKFAVNPGVAFSGTNTCAQPGGSLGITETGHVSSTYSYWNVPIDVTPGGKIESVTFSAQSCGAGPGNKVFVYEQGWPANCAGESQRIFHVNSEFYFGIWTIFLGCDGNYAPGCEAGPTVSAHYMAATEIDPVAPELAAPQGSLLAGGIVRGHQTLAAKATDVGGGLSKISVSVNGLPASQPDVSNCNLVQVKNPSVVGVVAATVTPCPSSLEPSWKLDTAAYPFHDGANTVEVCASDYASTGEPNTTCSPPQIVQVDNSCTESAVVGGQVLSAQFAESHDESVTVPFNRAAEVTGELSDNAGDAISGATICVQMQTMDSSGGLAPVGTTTTDASGHFSYAVPPGPNRKVLLGYRHDTFQVARSVSYYAHAKPTLRITPGKVRSGGRIRLSGTVPGPQAAGRVVVLQASALHSKRWFTFHRATTNDQGVFHSRYRFDATTRTTTYRIRAVVPKQSGYPWEVGHSMPALVEVRVGR